MTRLKLDPEMINLSLVMEKVTGVWVKDCFTDDEIIYFIVGSGKMGKALGKKGVNIKKVQELLNKRVKVIEFNENLTEFIKNIVYPLTLEGVTEEEGIVIIKESNKKAKSLLIGRGGKNLNLMTRAVKRFFNIKAIKVI